MDELLKALKTLYDGAGGATLRTKTTGGMWLSQAPQQSAGVYVVLTPVVAPVSYAMNRAFTQDCDIQFTLATLNGTSTNIVDAMVALEALYDFCTFTMTGKTLLVARRLSEQGPIRDDTTMGYLGYIEYRFMLGG